MIKLTLGDPPAQLTDEWVREKTEQFKDDDQKRSVWSYPWLKTALMAVSNGKCCYSECRLGESSVYMEIEHFLPKDLYPDKVLEWGNLLPASKKCNTTKRAWDPNGEPLIHPCIDEPRDHLVLKNFRFYPKDNSEKGKNTIEAVALNDRLHFLTPRARIAFKVLEELDHLSSDCEDFSDEDVPKQTTKFLKRFSSILHTGQPEEEYASTIATSILTSPSLGAIRTAFEKWNIWNDEHENLIARLESIAYLEDG